MLRHTATNVKDTKTPGWHRRPGLSLLEVLLAAVIFMMLLAGISILIRTAVDNAISAYRTNLGSSLARSKLAEIEAAASDVDITTGGSGTFTDQPDWNWEVTSANTGNGCGLCLEVHDVAVAKLAAGREKDASFGRDCSGTNLPALPSSKPASLKRRCPARNWNSRWLD